jgi:5-methylcytosine-specific restriction endonuclease McrA
MNEHDLPVDADALKRERAKARELRQSQWWKRRIERGVCHYCGRHVGRRALTMDHVVPLGRGGRSIRGNCVPACRDCNSQKQRLVPVEWTHYLATLAGRRDE